MAGLSKNPDPMAQLAARIRHIEARLDEALRRPTAIPVLDEDPPEDSPIQVWVLQSGRLRLRYRDTDGVSLVIREYEPVAAPGSSESEEPTPDPVYVPTLRQTTYDATWSATYRGAGPMRTDKPGLMGHGSSGDSWSGKMSSLIGFDYGAIMSDLSGATINNAWIVISNERSWYNSGTTLTFGGHGYGSAPGSWNGTGLPVNMAGTGHIGKGAKDVTLGIPLAIAQGFRDGTVLGVALQAPNSGREYYGYEYGVGSNHPPKLILNYTK